MAWIERLDADPTRFLFLVEAENGPVGYLMATIRDQVSGVGEIGLCLEATQQGRGIGRRALALAECFLYDAWRMRKIVVTVMESNDASLALFSRSGYRLVGRHAEHFYAQGRYHDVAVMEKMLQVVAPDGERDQSREATI